MTTVTLNLIPEILTFWFGDLTQDETPKPELAKRWWMKDSAFDTEIRSRFGVIYQLATSGQLMDWCTSAQGRLALILLLDQFSRNLYRNDPRAFSQDLTAQALATTAIAHAEDQQLLVIQRVFLYMPFMHSESLTQQDESVRLFERLVAESPASLLDMLKSNLDFAHQHRNIIARFDRFPHRNEVLGRKSTPEEIAFLKMPGSSF